MYLIPLHLHSIPSEGSIRTQILYQSVNVDVTAEEEGSREVKLFVQGHTTARKWQNQDLNPS